MKKIDYQTPETMVVELEMNKHLLAGSDGTGSTSDPNDPIVGGNEGIVF